jgi:hypothetical protein
MNERRWHLLAACTVSTIGLVIAGMTMGTWWALVGMSIAAWGLALGAACRNARPFELALLLAGYLSLQGAPVLDALAAPAVTALGHGLALPVAIALLAATWKPLIAVSR